MRSLTVVLFSLFTPEILSARNPESKVDMCRIEFFSTSYSINPDDLLKTAELLWTLSSAGHDPAVEQDRVRSALASSAPMAFTSNHPGKKLRYALRRFKMLRRDIFKISDQELVEGGMTQRSIEEVEADDYEISGPDKRPEISNYVGLLIKLFFKQLKEDNAHLRQRQLREFQVLAQKIIEKKDPESAEKILGFMRKRSREGRDGHLYLFSTEKNIFRDFFGGSRLDFDLQFGAVYDVKTGKEVLTAETLLMNLIAMRSLYKNYSEDDQFLVNLIAAEVLNLRRGALEDLLQRKSGTRFRMPTVTEAKVKFFAELTKKRVGPGFDPLELKNMIGLSSALGSMFSKEVDDSLGQLISSDSLRWEIAILSYASESDDLYTFGLRQVFEFSASFKEAVDKKDFNERLGQLVIPSQTDFHGIVAYLLERTPTSKAK